MPLLKVSSYSFGMQQPQKSLEASQLLFFIFFYF